MIGSFKKYAKYNGKEYLITTVGTEVRINTQKTDNTDEQFKPCKANPGFYRTISENELTDIYRYQLVAIYNSHIAGVSSEWDLTSHVANIEEKRVKLSLEKMGPFNGWEVCDRSFHIKWVDNSELEGAKIRFIYEKKNGIEYSFPLIEEKKIEVPELFKYFLHYKNI